MPEHSKAVELRKGLSEQLQPFPGLAELIRHKAGYVAAWSRQAIDQAGTDHMIFKHAIAGIKTPKAVSNYFSHQ